jgi:hypothetical protein
MWPALSRSTSPQMFSFIRCTACGSSAFSQTRGLVVVFGWTNLRLDRGEPTGLCRACAASAGLTLPLPSHLPATAGFDSQPGDLPFETVVLTARRWSTRRR